MKTLKFRASCIDLAIGRPGYEDALEVNRLSYQSVPGFVRQESLQCSYIRNYNCIATTTTSQPSEIQEKGGMSYGSYERPIQIDVKTVLIKETLTALQVLLVYLATFLFSSGQAE
jgi:hypothetical protein